MMFWQEMQEKWGFGDGDAVPSGAEMYRKVYVEVVNSFAKRLGSKYHYEPYDRPGLHNWCLVVAVRNEGEEVLDAIARPDEQDEALLSAVQAAYEIWVDELLVVDVSIDEASLRNLVEQIETGRVMPDVEDTGLAADPK